MAEEHRCQAPRLCINNCGFFGSPAMQNLCSRCYRDLQLKEQRSSSAKLVLSQTLVPPPSSSSSTSVESVVADSCSSMAADPPRTAVEENSGSGSVARPNRCVTCRRRVGLTGFKCRCGLTLCGSHRYPEQHGCGFDFKEMGREEIAKANPVVKAEKLRKI